MIFLIFYIISQPNLILQFTKTVFQENANYEKNSLNCKTKNLEVLHGFQK